MDTNNQWKNNNESESNDEWLLRAKRYAQALAHKKKLEEEQKKSQKIAIAALKAWKVKNSIVIYM
jgi:hypothetical protein